MTRKMSKQKGSIVNVLSVGITILAMSVIMMAYLNNMHLVQIKTEVSQLARKYILKMESVGYLTNKDVVSLQQELTLLGISEVDFSGSTVSEVTYGEPIYLSIQGMIQGKEAITKGGIFSVAFGDKGYPFREIRMSTAKN